MKAEISKLKEKYIQAKTDEEYEIIREEIRQLCDEDANAVAEAALESIKETNAELLCEKRASNEKI